MKKTMAFALALALTGAVQATTQHAAAVPGKVHVTANPAAQPANTPVAPAQNAAAPTGSNNMVCPPGIKPQQAGAAGKCFPRPTRNVQR